jgi:hypothetical protein
MSDKELTPADLVYLPANDVKDFIIAAARVKPWEAQAMLGGFIANIIGPIPELLWQRMMAESKEPCGRPDCGCESVRVEVFPALDKLRTDWLEQMHGI